MAVVFIAEGKSKRVIARFRNALRETARCRDSSAVGRRMLGALCRR